MGGAAAVVAARTEDELIKNVVGSGMKALFGRVHDLLRGRRELNELARHKGDEPSQEDLALALKAVLGDHPAALGELRDLLAKAEQEDAQRGSVYNAIQVNAGNSVGLVNSEMHNYYGAEGPRD